jgi:YVTN family beta-propeller protein
MLPRDIFTDDNGMIYVANIGSNAVSVINSTKDEVVKIIYLGAASGVISSVSADPETKMVYAGLSRDGMSGQILMINSTNPGYSNYIQVGPTPSDMVFNSDTSKIYVAKTVNGTVSVIDAKNNTRIKDISLGKLPSKIAINPNSNKIYVANLDSNQVSVINGTENKLLGDVSLPFNVADIAVNSKLNKIYAIGGNNKTLSIIDGTSDEVVKNETLSVTPSAIEFNPKTNRTYIASYNNWSLISIDSSNDNVTNGKVIDLNIPPESITVDPITNTLYVSSYVREDILPGETTHKPPSAAFPQRTHVQIIDGNNDRVMFNNKALKLDPKYGEVILAADPNNGDIIAVPFSSNIVLSWNLEQAKRVMENPQLGGILNVKEIQAGTDPTQVAFDVHGGKIYIINYNLNAILVDELKKYETQKLNNSHKS